MVQREAKDKKDRQFMQEYELGVFVANMKERYAEAIKLPSATQREKSVYLGPMGNKDFSSGDGKGTQILSEIKTGIDGLNRKLSPQP
jgi:hypothetical protein